MILEQQIIRMVIALALGLLIGFEREVSKKPAGLRTHVMVCMGAALVTIVAMTEFPDNAARLAAGIITGIGFLGAGSIMASKRDVKGLTTAASVWIVAAIGLAVGAGMYYVAVFAAVMTFIILRIGKMEHELGK